MAIQATGVIITGLDSVHFLVCLLPHLFSRLQRPLTPPLSSPLTSSGKGSRGPSPQPGARGISPAARSRLTPSPRRSPKRTTPSPVKVLEEGRERRGEKEKKESKLTNHAESKPRKGKGKGKEKELEAAVQREDKGVRASKKKPAKPLEDGDRTQEVSNHPICLFSIVCACNGGGSALAHPCRSDKVHVHI